MPDPSNELLRAYGRDRSELAFRELVRVHSGVVYGAALRILDGDRAAAQDVMQEVFTLLARKAPELRGVTLSGWLYRQACRRATNAVRSESRRRKREMVAASMGGFSAEENVEALGANVDQAMLALPAADRDALVLRFFESRDFRSVGSSLGVSEEAARKRVARALEKMAEILRSRGITTATASLATSMSGMAATAPPAAVISQVAAQALKAVPAGGWAALMPLLKSFLAGVVAASLGAGAFHAWHRSPEPGAVAKSAPAQLAVDRSQVSLAPVPADLSLEALIAELRRVSSGPGHTLTQLRIYTLLDQVTVAQIPEFVSLADRMLTSSQREASYPRLMNRWLADDPAAAVTFAVNQRFGEKIGAPEQISNIVTDLIHEWYRKDPSAVRKWLIAGWANENLDSKVSGATLRAWLAIKIGNDLLIRQGVPETMGFIGEIPVGEERTILVNELSGKRQGFNSPWMNVNSERRLEFCHALRALSPGPQGEKWARCFWNLSVRNCPEEVLAQRSLLGPQDLYDLSLAMLGVKLQEKMGHYDVDGRRTEVKFPVLNPQETEAAIFASGEKLGLSRQEILQEMAEELFTRQQDEAIGFVRAHRSETDFEEFAVRALSAYTVASYRDGYPYSAVSLLGLVDDPTRKARLTRATLRRFVQASNPAALRTFANLNEGYPELVEEFRSILEERP